MGEVNTSADHLERSGDRPSTVPHRWEADLGAAGPPGLGEKTEDRKKIRKNEHGFRVGFGWIVGWLKRRCRFGRFGYR